MNKYLFSVARQWGCSVRAVALLCISALFVPLSLAATQSVPPIPVANFTEFNDVDVLLEAHLNDELKQKIRARKLVVFALTLDFPERKACYAMVGLTHAAPTGVSSRVPAFPFSFFSVDASAGKGECAAGSLKGAIESMSADADMRAFDGLFRTESQGKRLMGEMANRKISNLSYRGLSESTSALVFTLLRENQFGKAFDYRHVSTYVYAEGTRIDDEHIMCVAVAGLTARSPQERNARWPTNNQSFVRIQDGGSIAGCESVVATQAVEALMARPWTKAGLLEDFARTREQGIPLPDAKKVENARSTFLAHSKPKPASSQAARTTSHNVLRCSNACRNGFCVRTFEDGRQERWQAPRKFDPHANNWGWDTTTNACGL